MSRTFFCSVFFFSLINDVCTEEQPAPRLLKLGQSVTTPYIQILDLYVLRMYIEAILPMRFGPIKEWPL